MPTSQRSIASQEFSSDAYQRLKDSLMHQEHFFESVIVATDTAGAEYVLMRSPTLTLLLIGTPLDSNPPIERTHSLQDSFYSGLYHTPLNASGSPQRLSPTSHAPYADHDINHSSPYSNGSSPSFTVQSTRAKEKKRPQTKHPHQQAPNKKTGNKQIGNKQTGSQKINSQKANQYRVSLMFDPNKIKALMAKLRSDSTVSWDIRSASSLRPTADAHTDSAYPNNSQPKTQPIAKESIRYPSSDAFFLAWAKDFAQASDNRQVEHTTVLEPETEQSLLLDQVITRIRHSLDLPSILETTVAQVREFLSADRLVLYQFTDPIGKAKEGTPAHTGAMNIGRTSTELVGQKVQVGHVTYEARLSEDISSVLNFAEEGCFGPSHSTYSRYLLGRPIAIDSVDEQYAHTGCLLDFLHKAQIKSEIIAPIIIKEQLWGLLIAHQCKDYRHWHETETVFLQHIAEHLAVAIEQASLYHQLRQQKVSLESCVIERTQNLQDALSAAASADRTKGEFLSTMSHELRTPLTYIIGMSATLLRWSFGELSERQRSYLTTINHSGEQLLGVINDILEFAKVESGRSLLNISDFSLSELMHLVVDQHQEMAESHDVTLAVECLLDYETDGFRADFKRIEQILSNLINNAVKFTPAGGQIIVRVKKKLDTALLQVEDSGIGIHESQKQFLFEKFKQLESPFQRQYPGTGLGLAMTKHLVELHGGTIKVDSVVGEGSTFTVSLPLQSKPPSSVRYQVPSALEQIVKPVVLLLETEENSAAIICELLTADGYEIICLNPADDIAAQMALLKPALLIADLSLLSHRQDEIKAIEQSITIVSTRVLALLGQPSSQSSHIAHHDTLDKPIDPKMLLEKSRQLTTAHV